MNVVLLIAGMSAVTYLPRLLPFVLTGRRRLGAIETRALRLIPVTAIGALIIPGSLTSVRDRTDLAALGLIAAVALSLLVRHPFAVVVGSVCAVALSLALGL